MDYAFLDKYANLDTKIHRIDPRVKIITLLAFIFFVIFTPITAFIKFYFYFLVIFSIILISRVPLTFIFKRSLVVVPFVLLVALFAPFLKEGEVLASISPGIIDLAVTYSGILVFLNVLMKSWLSVLAMVTLTTTTKSPELLKGFEKLKMPKVMVMIISFMYRYLFVLVEEVMVMKRARDSRCFNISRIGHIKSIGSIIAVLFIRSYERGERVYYAMLSRGFNGNIRTLDDFKIKGFDVFFSGIIFIILTSILIF